MRFDDYGEIIKASDFVIEEKIKLPEIKAIQAPNATVNTLTRLFIYERIRLFMLSSFPQIAPVEEEIPTKCVESVLQVEVPFKVELPTAELY